MSCDIYQDLAADKLRQPPYPKISPRLYAVAELALKEAWKNSVDRHYCDKGIHRFLVGDYAWAMQDALMVGYATTSCSIGKHLLPKVTKNPPDRFTSSTKPFGCECSKEDNFAGQTLLTTHPRKFLYGESTVMPPEIVLRHLWLKRC